MYKESLISLMQKKPFTVYQMDNNKRRERDINKNIPKIDFLEIELIFLNRILVKFHVLEKERTQKIQLNVIELIREINAESQSIENLLTQKNY